MSTTSELGHLAMRLISLPKEKSSWQTGTGAGVLMRAIPELGQPYYRTTYLFDYFIFSTLFNSQPFSSTWQL